MIDLSIIIISYNTKKLTLECINSIIRNTHGISYEIIMVDNASDDGSVKAVEKLSLKFPIRVISNSENVGFGQGNNQGMKIEKGRYILLLNTDTLIKGNLLCEMVNWMDKNKEVGISSCALKNKDGSIQGTGGYFPTLFRVFAWMTFLEDLPGIDYIIKPFHPMHGQSPFYKAEGFFKKTSERDWITGAYLLMRKEVVNDIGYFDHDYFMYTEEVDYCFRAKEKGWKVWYLPKWSIIHYGGASSTKEFPILSEFRGIKTFYKKHMTSWEFWVLRLLLKLGSLLRIFVLGILKGSEAVKTYAKAFQIA